MDLFEELRAKTEQLNVAIKQLRINGTAFAEAERDYKILLRTECLKMRDGKTPVTLVDKLCYGIPSVAEARFKRDCAEAVYKANLEAINSIKLQIRIIDNQISREWNNGQVDY